MNLADDDFTLFGLPDLETQTTRYQVTIPYVLGLIATRSLDKQVEGIKPLVERTRDALLGHGALGARMIGIEMAKACVTQFLETAFLGDRHVRRVEKLSNPERSPA